MTTAVIPHLFLPFLLLKICQIFSRLKPCGERHVILLVIKFIPLEHASFLWILSLQGATISEFMRVSCHSMLKIPQDQGPFFLGWCLADSNDEALVLRSLWVYASTSREQGSHMVLSIWITVPQASSKYPKDGLRSFRVLHGFEYIDQHPVSKLKISKDDALWRAEDRVQRVASCGIHQGTMPGVKAHKSQ
ncbi:hypothetical protein EDD85DRAFT_784297 [Armillaria nabsnona]|nr:hypothetical protein EDD85DRAFT_784297 [Armillaria nabsnona]